MGAADAGRARGTNSARLNFTLSPHNFHALVESYGHNRRGYIAWGIGDASIGHFPGHQSPLSHRRYRPELHYMRGPGPKWFERHGR